MWWCLEAAIACVVNAAISRTLSMVEIVFCIVVSYFSFALSRGLYFPFLLTLIELSSDVEGAGSAFLGKALRTLPRPKVLRINQA
jgi:hypothetical protein